LDGIGALKQAPKHATFRINVMNSAFIQPSAHLSRTTSSGQLNLLTSQSQTLGTNSGSQSACPASPNLGTGPSYAQWTPGLVTPPLQGPPNRIHAAYYHVYHHSNHLANNIVARLGTPTATALNYWQQPSCPFLSGQERPAVQSDLSFLSGSNCEDENGAGYRLFESVLDQLENTTQQARNASTFWLTSTDAEHPDRMDTFGAEELEELEQQLYQVPLAESEYGGLAAPSDNFLSANRRELSHQERSASAPETIQCSSDIYSSDEEATSSEHDSDICYAQFMPAGGSTAAQTLSPLSGSSAVGTLAQQALREHSTDNHLGERHLFIRDSDVAFYIALTSPNISKARYTDIIANMKRRGVIDTGNTDWEKKLVQVRASRPVPKHLARAMSGENAIACAERAVLVASAREKDIEGKSVVTECEKLSACMTVPTEWIVPVDASRRRKSISLDQLLPSLNRKVHQSNNVLLFVLLKKQDA
jgi:hypothetical protein